MERWERQALDRDAHEEVEIEAITEAELLALGYRRSLGTPKGQQADYRRPLDDGRGLHVRRFEDRMTVHWDRTAVAVSLVGHVLDDAPAFAWTSGLTLAALLALPFL